MLPLRLISEFMEKQTIQNALISVFDKQGIDELVTVLHESKITIYSTGGTFEYIKSLGIPAIKIETLTGYPEMLEGRVKTLHPAVFAGILAKRTPDHLSQIAQAELPLFDLVVVNLYPFEDTVASGAGHDAIIEKIDIGGVSLIRAAAKNYQFLHILCKPEQYASFTEYQRGGNTIDGLDLRRQLATEAFKVTSDYDAHIYQYLSGSNYKSTGSNMQLKYGENPHQSAELNGNTETYFHQLAGKQISFNNLMDIESALKLKSDFNTEQAMVAIFKHNNPCGVAIADSPVIAWRKALDCDPTSAFGGVIILNRPLELDLAREIDELFFEVVMATEIHEDALQLLKGKKNRIILRLNPAKLPTQTVRSFMDLRLVQDTDTINPFEEKLEMVTNPVHSPASQADLHLAIACVKHLKSNAISIVKNGQMIGAGTGQTSRVDALLQAIDKAKKYNFDLTDSIVGSDAFFPFADTAELIFKNGIKTIVQPGGSIRDKEVIAFCNEHNIEMYFTGIRHFKH